MKLFSEVSFSVSANDFHNFVRISSCVYINGHTLHVTAPKIDDYAKDGGPGEVWHCFSFYHDSLRPLLFYLVSYEAHVHKLTSNSF